MQQRSGSRVAGGGIFIALGVLGGLIGGSMLGEPSLGILAGLGIGVALAVLTWLMTR